MNTSMLSAAPFFSKDKTIPSHDQQNGKQIITALSPIALSPSLYLSNFFLNFRQTCKYHRDLGTFSNLFRSDYWKMYL